MAMSGRNRAQDAVRGHGSRKCSKHYGKEVLYVCKLCDILVCVECIVEHEEHMCEEISYVISEAKQKLQEFIANVEQKDIPLIQRKFKNVDEDITKNKEYFRTQVSLIKNQNETLKKELDKIADMMVKTCHDIEYNISDTLINYQKELQSQMDILNTKIQEVKASLRSGNDVLVYDTNSHTIWTPLKLKDNPVTSCNTAEFTSGKLPQQQLEDLFGELNIIAYGQQNQQKSPPLSMPTNSNVTSSELALYDGHTAKSMHAVGDEIWLSFLKIGDNSCSNKMLSVNQNGQIQQTLDLDVPVHDFCLSPLTGSIWFCSDKDTNIRVVYGNKASVKFTINTWPWCMCSTKDGHILVGSNAQIKKYTQTGVKKCSTSKGHSRPIMDPYHMSECPVTKCIAVVDRNRRWSSGGDDKPIVSILNEKLQLIHTFSGELSARQQPPPNPFCPQDVHFTNKGELVITDRNNKTVVLVTGTGRYKQTLYSHSKSPLAVCVHHDTLWVSFSDGSVKMLKDYIM